MKNKIQEELNESFQYDLKTEEYDGSRIVLLTRENVALVESMIRNDSDYINSGKEDDENHSPIWLRRLKDCLIDGKSVSDGYDYNEIVYNCVKKIDKENSTHITSDGVGLEELSSRITELDKTTLVNYLRNPQVPQNPNDQEDKGYKLVDILSKKTQVKKDDKKYRARSNYSFATKFCHYACYYIFEGLPEQDNFSIFDSVVRKHIGKYIKRYNVKVEGDYRHNYASYIKCIDGILQGADNQISRNGFDHLLWYYHKARP